MEKGQTSTPWTSYLFIAFLMAGLIIMALSLFVIASPSPFDSLRRLGTGLLLIGLGEWINHPHQEEIQPQADNGTLKHEKHRRRNPNSLGNLIEITGIILVVSAGADFI